MTLVPLPAQPSGLPWPAPDWAEGPVPPRVELAPLLDAAFDTEGPAGLPGRPGPLGVTYAVVVIHRRS